MYPTGRSRTAIVACLLVVSGVVLGSVGTWLWTVSRGENGAGSGNNLLGDPVDLFVIQGELDSPIYPGGSYPLDLSITNTNETPLILFELNVAVNAVSAPNATAALPCTAKDFAVKATKFDDRLVLPPKVTKPLSALGVPDKLWPVVAMVDSVKNQDGCKGATLALSYTGTGKLDR